MRWSVLWGKVVILAFFLMPGKQAQAQMAPPLPAYPRYFVGVVGAAGNYGVAYPRLGRYLEGVLGPGVSFGYQLSANAAVQASVTWSITPLYLEDIRQNAAGQYVRLSSFRADHQHIALPLLLRLNGTRRPNRRLQFDVLVGAVVTRAWYSRIEEIFDNNQCVTFHSEQSEHVTNLALSLGGGIRYRFGRHLEGVGDANLNYNVASPSNSGFVNVYNAGLRYRFGYR